MIKSLTKIQKTLLYLNVILYAYLSGSYYGNIKLMAKREKNEILTLAAHQLIDRLGTCRGFDSLYHEVKQNLRGVYEVDFGEDPDGYEETLGLTMIPSSLNVFGKTSIYINKNLLNPNIPVHFLNLILLHEVGHAYLVRHSDHKGIMHPLPIDGLDPLMENNNLELETKAFAELCAMRTNNSSASLAH